MSYLKRQAEALAEEKPYRVKNLKPSQLPEGSVIDDLKQGEYIKRSGGVWEETSCDYMGDRERVSDRGYERFSDMPYALGLSWCEKSDVYFKSYILIASTPGFTFDDELLHGVWVDAYGSYIDGTPMHDCEGYNCDAEVDIAATHNRDLIATLREVISDEES